MHLTEGNCNTASHLYCPSCRTPIGVRSSPHQLLMELPGGFVSIGAAYMRCVCANCGQVSETKQSERTGRMYLIPLRRTKWPSQGNFRGR